MSFYTSVDVLRNRIVYRGYTDNGTPITSKYEFQPNLFVPSKEDYGWRSLEGHMVQPIGFDSPSAMRDWVKDKEGLQGFRYYGCDRPVIQFIHNKFPDEIKFNMNMINVVNLDIEVHSEDGFPHAEEAAHPIVAITAKSSRSSVYHVWGIKDYDPAKSPHKHLFIQYHKCKNEVELLVKFVSWWKKDYPDVITGWNIRFFDMPYIINRIKRLGSEEVAKTLSPWHDIRMKQVQFKNKNMDSYQLTGISQMDYYDLFTKFAYAYGPQESYRLDHIAHIVLGERKLSYEEYGNLRNLYNENHQLYIDYNIKDVELVERIDQHENLMELALTIAYKAGVNFTDVFGTTSIWDSIVYRELTNKYVAVPAMADRQALASMETKFAGGYVKEVNPAMYEYVVSFDLASLYPNIIAQWNMSPETLLKTPDAHLLSGVDHYLDNQAHPAQMSRNASIAANGSMYDNSQEGVFPSIVKAYYAERKDVKKLMLDAMKEKEELLKELAELEKIAIDNK